jgi:hypothetical protein
LPIRRIWNSNAGHEQNENFFQLGFCRLSLDQRGVGAIAGYADGGHAITGLGFLSRVTCSLFWRLPKAFRTGQIRVNFSPTQTGPDRLVERVKTPGQFWFCAGVENFGVLMLIGFTVACALFRIHQ